MNHKINKILDLIKKNQFKEAKNICDDIKQDLDNNYEFNNIFGYILFRLENHQEAIKLLKKAIYVKPDFAFALNNLGNIYSRLSKYDEALKYFNEALKIKQDYFEASYGISEVYLRLHKYEDALFHLNKSIKLKPNFLPTIKSKLQILRAMDKKKEALKFLNEIINFLPNEAYLYNEKALILSELGRHTESINSFKSAYLLDPGYPFILGNILFDKLINCDWDKIEKDYKEIIAKIKEEKNISDPLTISYICDSPLLQSESAKIFINYKKSGIYDNYNFQRKEKDKINLGYYSADFRNHPVAHLLSRTIELHDKSKFNVHGFYFGKKNKKGDHYHSRLKKAFQHFHDVANKSDQEIVNLSRDLGIDIAIDLMGHTGGFENRIEIFLKRCAPIQINYLGYPGTIGTNKIDYIIADKNLINEEDKEFYSEKVIYLPNSYQPNEKNRVLSKKKLTKKQLNLPDDKFIFCCFNSNQKILKNIFNLWVEILAKTPESILWLLSNNNRFIKNLKEEFEKKNINSERILFSNPISVEEHLLRIKFADLFLDTFPYNAHTTCSESLWAGVPVLTKRGNSFHSRVASSLLKTSNLDELITHTDKDYVDKAVKIGNDKYYLKHLKDKLTNSKNTNPLFDSETYTKNLEQALEVVYKRYLDKNSADDIYL